jgi:hypothetical protein
MPIKERLPVSHPPATRTLRALLRFTAIFLASAVLAGCSLSGKGYLFTQDSAPLRLADDLVLEQGHMRLQFAPNPWLLGRLRLHNDKSSFSTWVSAADYAGNSFFIDSVDSGLAYDIQARWRESRAETVERDSYQRCTTAGFCSKTVSRLTCGKKRYQEGSERYEEHAGDDNCEEDLVFVTDNFPDCPGSQRVRKRYQVYQLLVSLDFRKPLAPKEQFAVFDGESQYRERPLDIVEEGGCEVR